MRKIIKQNGGIEGSCSVPILKSPRKIIIILFLSSIDYLVVKFSHMLLNLSRAMHFDSNKKTFDVDYQFTRVNEKFPVAAGEICLELSIQVNAAAKTLHHVSKPTSTLYLSNEAIEKMVEEETLRLG